MVSDLNDKDVVRGAHAALVAHAINTLSTEDTCCPHGCAPCMSLVILHDLGVLDDAVRPYTDLTGDWSWWDQGTGTVRWSWITERWCEPTACDYVCDDDENHGDHYGG